MRRRSIALVVTLSLGFFFATPFSSAQEHSEAKRKVVNKVVPVYPDLARKMQLSGTVKIEVVVAANGKLKSSHVVGGNPVLSQAAESAVEKWRWEPGSLETKELIELNFHPQ